MDSAKCFHVEAKQKPQPSSNSTAVLGFLVFYAARRVPPTSTVRLRPTIKR